MIAILTSLLLLGSATPDSTLVGLGRDVVTMRAQGTFSSRGAQNFSGLPFTAVMDTNQSFRLTISAPFGLTAARMWAERDTFVFVNYMMQEVHEGRTSSPSLTSALPFPMPANHLMDLMRGRTPGNPERFTRSEQRTDGAVLFTCKDTLGVEYLLVDTARSCLRQYQRKGVDGAVELDVSFQELNAQDGITLPHLIDIAVENRKQGASFHLTKVELNKPINERLTIDIPKSFSRTTYR